MPNSVKSGLAGQYMMSVAETTYGTAVATTRSLELVDETLKLTVDRIESKGLRAGRRLVGKWYPGKRSVAGDLQFEVSGSGFGLMFNHCFGAAAVTGAGPTYTHTFNAGDLPVGFTSQVGKPSIDGTVQPFTYPGCRVASWELSVKAGELLMLKPAIIAQDEVTTTGLTTYADPGIYLLSYAGGTITAGGTQVDLTDFTLKGDNKLDNARFRVRGAATPKQPLENSWREYTGTLTADFEALTQYNHYVNADEFTLVATFLGPAIPAGGGPVYTLTVTANIRYNGDTPAVTGPGLLTQPLPFTVVGSGATDVAALSMTLLTGDAAL
jgi:Phage tail tube protein